jgi:hypothetical protein
MKTKGAVSKKQRLSHDENFINTLGKVPDRVLAEKYDISTTTVANWRKVLGIKCLGIRGTAPVYLPISDSEFISEVEELKSYAEVARKYGVSRQAVWARIKNVRNRR